MGSLLDPEWADALPPGVVGVAVSGGGDSVALLMLLRESGARELAAVTVDHSLRPESVAEAQAVARLCSRISVPHTILHWENLTTSGNLQSAARDARQRLIGEWAAGRGIASVALGHTLDDQAETFLLRLARGSGIDGLSAMIKLRRQGGLLWVRPLLGARRHALRDFLTNEEVTWADDPSNEDQRFDRVRARAVLPLLAPLGLGPERLAATAEAMGRARIALKAATASLAADALEEGQAGDLSLDPGPILKAPEEISLRLLGGALTWVAGARYGPRLGPLKDVLAAVIAGGVGHGRTIHGCVLRERNGRVVILREPAHAAPPVPLASSRWDGRWEVSGSSVADAEIGALGAEGLAALGDWRATGLAREALLTTPAIRQAGRLLAAPVIRPVPGLRVRRIAALPPPWSPDIVR